MILRQSSSSRALIAVAGGALLMGLAATTPAKALDDGADNIFSSIAQLLTVGVGLGGDKPKPTIEYRERPPLVLPPNLQNLPPPGNGVAARNPNWPEDSDLQRHRRALARQVAPREAWEDVGGRNAPVTPAGAPIAAANDPTQCRDDTLEALCDTEGFWKAMRSTSGPRDPQQVAIGQEPPRRSLTDPPPGFRRQTTAQKYTFEVRERIDIADPNAQRLEEERRARAIARGENPD